MQTVSPGLGIVVDRKKCFNSGIVIDTEECFSSDIVIGEGVTFKWKKTATRKQRSYKLYTNHDSPLKMDSGSEQLHWVDYPFGTGWWYVKIYRKSGQNKWIGTTSKQNFYHYNNVPGVQNLPDSFESDRSKLYPFEFKKGARKLGQLRDLTIFYEVLNDYTVDLKAYFADISKLPKKYAKWRRSESQHKALLTHIDGLSAKWEFVELDKGLLTLKKGYRWDGTSNPWVWEEKKKDLRASGIHDSIYGLMRMGYLTVDNDSNKFVDEGFKNRLVADIMWYRLSVEDGRTRPYAQLNFRVLRDGGFGKTHKDKLLYPWNYRVSELTARASDRKVELHWRPANIFYKDPKKYHLYPHRYEIYRSTAGSPTWTNIGHKYFAPPELIGHDDSSVYFTDHDVTNGEIYYYWIRVNDPDSDGDGWTDQEERDYHKGKINNRLRHPYRKEMHYDESDVEAAVPVENFLRDDLVLELDGENDYVEANSVASDFIATAEPADPVDPGDLSGIPLTMEARVFPEVQWQNGKTAILAFNQRNGEPLMTLIYDGMNQQFCYFDGEVGHKCDQNYQIVPQNWYHVAVTIDEDGNGLLLVDGVHETHFTTRVRPRRTALFSIGQQWQVGVRNTSMHFRGEIDEVRIWDIARDQGDLLSYMGDPMQGYHEGMLAQWHFDEPGDIFTTYDATKNSNDGNIIRYDFDPDDDDDGKPDFLDNCQLAYNPSQFDADSDGYGNACDADLNNDLIVDSLDIELLKLVFLSADTNADINEDGIVNSLDLGLVRNMFLLPPGPSAIAP
ncbi:MAG: hypothetical protein DRR42_20230 [Gammaproteobacteria bacterium]|nr:MAG: hypothetical protein DRR42_20230 [Gammaproteobacteria bacterium]